MIPTVPDSSTAEIEAFERVCTRLGGFDADLAPEYVDGWLAGLAAALVLPPFGRWIEALAGDAFDRAFADPEDRAAGERALAARLAVLRRQLDPEALDASPDALRLAPLLYPWTDEDRERAVADGMAADEARGLVTGADWADGVLAAIAAFGDDAAIWPRDVGAEAAEDFKAILGGVAALHQPDGEGVDRERLVDDACFALQDLRLWAVDHAPRPETRRVDKTPGRNDPCPCGSGRKYKKCHGA